VVSIVLKENPKGRKSIVQLPDGSVVRLNSESRITYPEHFSNHERVVHLVGEAFFEVKENKESPFSVVTGDIITTVLGTSFNIQAWDDESTINVSLAAGKVSVSKIGSSIGQAYYLNPGEKIIHEKNSNVFNMMNFDNLEEMGWKDGVLVFKQANLSEVINKISRWYDVEFELIGRQNEAWSFDGRFINESLNDVLETLSYTYKIDYKFVNKKVILHL
jgi:transmembrane sensor